MSNYHMIGKTQSTSDGEKPRALPIGKTQAGFPKKWIILEKPKLGFQENESVSCDLLCNLCVYSRHIQKVYK